MPFALTFDDGPGPCTEEILDSLAAHGARATFFVLGRNLAEAPWAGGDTDRARRLVVRALREGHVVGNHTYSHQRPPEACAGLPGEIARTDGLIRSCRAEAGVPVDAPIPFRLPYGVQLPGGALDPRLFVAAGAGRPHMHWTGDFADWEYGDEAPTEADVRKLAAAMIAHVERTDPAVLDLHDSGTGSGRGYVRRATARAVARLLDEAARRGWKTFTVPV